MKYKISLFYITFLYVLLFTGCSKHITESNTDSIVSETPDMTAEENIEENAEESAKDEPVEQHDYMHGDEGYYSLADEGVVTNVKSQLSGTCWVTAAATSMESAYKIAYGEDIIIDFMDILDYVLVKDKGEGYLATEGIDVNDIGGYGWQIVETLSNGFGEYVLVNANDYRDTDTQTLKNAIKNVGALSVGINDSRYHSKDGYKTLRASMNDDADHGTTLIGWDDNFPKDYFYPEADEDGAFLVQNTRSEFWGNGGRYWASYDTALFDILSLELSKEYSEVLFHEYGNEKNFATKNITKVANVFHKNGALKGVGVYTTKPNQSITIEVLDDKFGNPVYNKEAVFERNGYHVVKIDEPIDVDDFVIAVTFDGEASFEGESFVWDGIAYTAGIDEGESFIWFNDKWNDLSDENTLKILGTDYALNNCCIKALF